MPGHWLVGDTRPDPDARRAAVLLAVTGGDTSGDETSVAELARLAGTDGLDVVGEVTQARPHPDPTTFIGAGKVDELTALVRDRNAAVVIADAELSPAQIRNLEDRTGVRVVDRTALILDVFAQHAQSREGRAQVEPHSSPTSYRGCAARGSRCRGWVVAVSPAAPTWGSAWTGEQRIESERRRLRSRMANLRG